MEEDLWYSFLALEFREKAHIAVDDVRDLIEANPGADVALFSSFWCLPTLNRNPWLHGRRSFPGAGAPMDGRSLEYRPLQISSMPYEAETDAGGPDRCPQNDARP